MTTGFRGDDVDTSAGPTFADVLQTYKARGNNTLVVGTVPQTIAAHLSQTHLGAVDEERYRVLAVTNGDSEAAARRFPSELSSLDQDKASLITYSTTARGATATESQSTHGSVSTPSVELTHGDGLNVFKESVLTEIDTLQSATTGGFVPAQLRVSLDGLEPLLGMAGKEAVNSFVEDLTGIIRTYRGMGQFFLSYPRSHSVVEALEAHFDIIVTVEQQTDGSYTQTWELPEHDIQTRLPLQTG